MNSCTINLEVISWAGAQQNETFKGWYEMQRKDTTPLEINGSKTISSFDKEGNQRDKLSNSGIQKCP